MKRALPQKSTSPAALMEVPQDVRRALGKVDALERAPLVGQVGNSRQKVLSAGTGV
jgi:hypothetical protein